MFDVKKLNFWCEKNSVKYKKIGTKKKDFGIIQKSMKFCFLFFFYFFWNRLFVTELFIIEIKRGPLLFDGSGLSRPSRFRNFSFFTASVTSTSISSHIGFTLLL